MADFDIKTCLDDMPELASVDPGLFEFSMHALSLKAADTAVKEQ